MGIRSGRQRYALLVFVALWIGCASNGASEASATDSDPPQEAQQAEGGGEAGAPVEDIPARGDADAAPAADAPISAPVEPVEEAAEGGAGAKPPAAVSPGVPAVAMARFTTAVENREPVDAVSFLGNDQSRILFFTDLRNLNQTVVLHRWEHKGRVMAEVRFTVQSDRWRVWSSKRLMPEWLGDWRASVVTENGEVLATEAFTYQELP